MHVGILAAEGKFVVSAVPVVLLGVDSRVDTGEQLGGTEGEGFQGGCDFLLPF